MTDPVTLTVAAITLVVAVLIGWFHLPRRPALDGERWFKLWLATLLRGRADAADLDAEAWAASVVRFVPYHPAGRLPERKVQHPDKPPPQPALDGEIALLEALAREPDPPARWARMYDLDERAVAARLMDPADLGADYDPARWLGPRADWDAVADAAVGEGALPEALRRASRATWVLVPGTPRPVPDVLGALQAVLGDRAVLHGPDVDVPLLDDADALRDEIRGRRAGDTARAEAAVHLLAHLRHLAPGYEDRLVLVGSGEGIHTILDAVRALAPLRDQLEAVVSVGGLIGGREGDDGALGWAQAKTWLDAHFRHDALDLEAGHRVPYLAVQWLDRQRDPPGAADVDLARARFPAPTDPEAARRAIRPVDLGPLPVDPDLPTDLVALALWGVTTCMARAERP